MNLTQGNPTQAKKVVDVSNPANRGYKRTQQSCQNKQIGKVFVACCSGEHETAIAIKRNETPIQTRRIFPCTNDRIPKLFKKILKEAESRSLNRKDISTRNQPHWFQSRWLWKATLLLNHAFEITPHLKNTTLDLLLNTVEKKDPYLRYILSVTFLKKSGSLGTIFPLTEKMKDIIPLWLRYIFATKGFDVTDQWLQSDFFSLPGANKPASDKKTYQFKFTEGLDTPEHLTISESEYFLKKDNLRDIGIEPDDISIENQPSSMCTSLWLIIREVSHWLRQCTKDSVDPLSDESIKKHKDLAFLKGLLQCLFSDDMNVGHAEKTDCTIKSKSSLHCDPLPWERLRVELILDRLSTDKYYPKFSSWRNWLTSN